MSALLQLVAGLSLAGHLFAQVSAVPDDEVIGEQGDIAEAQEAPAAQNNVRISAASGTEIIRDYEQQLIQLEGRYGAYHAELAEVVQGLGLAQQQRGDHEDAIVSLNRALQIHKVNQGLYHVSKIPLIEQLIVSYAATANWEAVDDRYFTLMQLYARNYNNNDVELLKGLAKLISWHLRAFGANLTEQPVNHLLLARELLFQSIQIIKINYSPTDLRLLEPLAALVLTDYYQAAAQLKYEEQASKASFNSFREEPGKAFADNWSPYQNMFTQGKNHIEEMIHITRINPETPPRTAVDALVLLADWNLVFKKKMTADEIYKQVWAQIMTFENSERHLDEIFRQPVSLPNISVSGTSFSDNRESAAGNSDNPGHGDDGVSQDGAGASDGLSPSTAGLGAIVIEFTITSSGRPIEAEVIETDPGASKNTIVKAKRQLKASRYRPRYENGVAVEAPNVRIRYLFEPDPELIVAEADNEE